MGKHCAILVDDNEEHLNLLASLLSKYAEIDIVEKISDPTTTIEKALKHQPEVLFLDIEMPVMSGFEVVESLAETKLQTEIVFVTSHDEYAIKAFEYAAFDYLVKPIDPDRLEHCIRRIKSSNNQAFKSKAEKLKDTYNKLIYKSSAGYTLVDPDDIIFIEADGNYSIIQLTSDRKDIFSVSIGDIEKDLPESFFKAHRSVIINLDKLYKVNTKKKECVLRDHQKEYSCKITRENISELLSRIR